MRPFSTLRKRKFQRMFLFIEHHLYGEIVKICLGSVIYRSISRFQYGKFLKICLGLFIFFGTCNCGKGSFPKPSPNCVRRDIYIDPPEPTCRIISQKPSTKLFGQVWLTVFRFGCWISSSYFCVMQKRD